MTQDRLRRGFRLTGLTSRFAVFLASLLVFAVAIPLFPGLNATAQSSNSEIEFVSPSWVADHANDANLRVLDVRINPFDYFTAHIPGSVHIADNTFRGPNGVLPVQYWQPEKLESLFQQAGVNNDSTVVIYSDGRDVLGATMVAYLLERSGLAEVAVLDGGFTGYQTAGLPVTKEFPSYEVGNFTVRDNPDVRVTLAEVRELVGQPDITFVDPRPAPLFSGEQEIWVRNGHIPGAKNLPWPTFTAGEANFHQLKPLDEIRQLLSERNIQPSDTIIMTCSTGREATLQYTVLKHLLGYPNVRVYEGSWTEYSSQLDLPIETGPGA